MVEFSPGDFVLPRWTIVQPTSRKSEKAGHFYRSSDGQTRPHLDVVILDFARTRVLWPQDPGARAPECKSNNGIVGTQYGECASCAFNPDNQKPGQPLDRACRLIYNYIVYDLDDQDGGLAVVEVSGRSINAAKQMNGIFFVRQKPLYAARVRFGTRLEEGRRGRYYVLTAQVLEWFEDEKTIAEYRQLRDLLLGTAVETDDKRNHEDR